MIKYAETDEISSDSEKSPERRLNSDSDSDYKVKAKSKKKRTSSRKGRDYEFKSKNKFKKKQKKVKEDSDSDKETSKFASRQSQLHVPCHPSEDELSYSMSRFQKAQQKAINEMEGLTSEDEERIKDRKREHLLNSIQKENPRSSKRLDIMLKNAADLSENSIEMTPSNQNAPQIVPEKHPYTYEIPQPGYPGMGQNFPNGGNFQPEATFSPHAQQPYPMGFNPALSMSYNHNPLNQTPSDINHGGCYPGMGYNEPVNPVGRYNYQPSEGYPMIPGVNPQNLPARNYPSQAMKFDCESPIKNSGNSKNWKFNFLEFGESKNARRELYDDSLFDMIDDMESEDPRNR